MRPAVRERAIKFGSHDGLVGIVTEPTSPRGGARQAVVMSNIGTHHRVGPYRIYAELARALAAAGYWVLRFDLSGNGDSENRPGTLDLAQSMFLDVTEAMDWMAAHAQVESFLLVGLCSGVDSAYAVAVADRRVSAAVFIDGYTYPTPPFYVRRYLLRPFAPQRWRRYFKRRMAEAARKGRAELASPDPIFARAYPSLAQFRADVAAMTGRGTALLFAFTGGYFNLYYNARGQLFEQLGRDIARDRLTVEFMPEADHIFSKVQHRADLVTRIVTWASGLEAPSAKREEVYGRT
jgi:alpha/beta superfamily hydrolase